MAISVGIGIEGEKQFKAAISGINKNLAVLSSEMTKVTAAYDANDQSVDALRSKQSVYNKQIAEQKNKIDTLKQALVNSANEYGENSTQAKNWQIALNKAEAELSKTERALKETTEATDDLGGKLDEAGEESEKSGGRFAKLGGILKNVGIAMGTVAIAAAAAASKLGKEVVKQFGELEQNLGGSEAVFGAYAERIQKIGEDAYKNMGVSQSQYLATANKMGALFQGSGIDQQRSLELTEQAMQRAADMASVMGIDMQVALEAVTGAAKGNFTMMDNLGVAMNATSIQAYALAKGLDFTWATASQAEKAEIAMQMFLENTTQYAGNFAREATQTITGSIGMLKAATQSFVAGLGNANADMTNLTQNMMDAFQAVVKNVVPVLENIVKALPTVTGAIIVGLGDLLPMLLQTVTSIFTQVLETLLGLLPELIPAVVEALITITGALIDNLPLIITAAVTLITALVQGIGMALPQLIPATIAAITQIVFGLIDNLPMLLDAALQLVLGLAQGILDALPELIAALPEIIIGIVDFLIGSLPQIIDAGVKLLTSLIADLPTIIVEIVKALPQIIVAIVNGIIEAVPAMISAGGDLIRGLWQGIANMGTWLWDKIKGFFKGITDKVKDFFGIKSPSRVFADLGKMIPAGFAVGVKDAMPQAISDIEAQFAGVTANVSPDVRMSGGAAAGGNVVNIYPQSMTEAQFDYIYAKMNARLAT